MHSDVKREFSKAYVVLADSVAYGGPKKYGTAWPDIRDLNDDWKNYNSDDKKSYQGGRQRIARTSREIARMEKVMIGYKHPTTKIEIMGWIAQFLLKRHKLVDCLVIYAISDMTNIPEKSLARRKGIAYSTYRSRRDDAARIIASNLNRLSIPMF